MIFGQGHDDKGFHAPVGTARGIVLLAHVELRVGIADGQHAIAVKDGLFAPPLQVAHNDALHDGQRQRFQPGEHAGGIKRTLTESVAETAPVRQRRAVLVKPESKFLAERHCALPEHLCALGVALSGKNAVQYTVILDGPGNIIVALRLNIRRAVGIPAAADIPGIHLVKVLFHQRKVAGHPDRVQRQIDKDAEEQPVAVGQRMVVDGIQPAGEILLFGIGQRVPDRAGHFQNGRRNGRHLDKKLVAVLRVTPVFRIFGVGAGGKAAAVNLRKVLGPAAAHPVGRKCPERAGEPFHLNRAARIGRAGLTEGKQRPAGRIERLERVKDAQHQRLKVRAVLKFHSPLSFLSVPSL